MKTTARLASAICALALFLPAQSLSLDKFGGGLPGTTTWTLNGPPNAPYILLFAFREETTVVGPVTLEIPLDELSAVFTLPGFVGTLNAAGTRTVSIAIPADPILTGLVVSCQAVAGSGPFLVSNLVRVTLADRGTFSPALNDPAVPIAGGATAPAPNASILFAGGSGPVAQRYNSRIEEWELAGSTFGVGLLSQATGLADGRILFTGGLGLDGQPTDAAAVYDPVTQVTTPLTMVARRAGHGASLMGNGRVLISGGFLNFDLTDLLAFFSGVQNSSEIFDPVTMTFTAGPNMLEARGFHSSTTLANGQVLVAGGLSLIPFINVPTVSATAYRFNPATNSFGLPATFSGSRFLHTAVPLSDGKVLLAGGITLDLTQFLTTLDPTTIIVGTRTDCQLFTVGAFGFGTFTTVNALSEGRAGAAGAPLPNGGALIAGGFNVSINATTSTFGLSLIQTADRFSQGPNAIVPTGSLAEARFFPVTTPLPDGTIMVVGGGGATAEIYQP
jgi:hypothetical protein